MIKKIFAFGILGLFATASVFANRPYHEQNHKERFAKMDKNNDGFITADEWTEKFNGIDTNKDGKISSDEMQVHHQQNFPGKGPDGKAGGKGMSGK